MAALGLASVSAFFLLQLLRPRFDSLGRPVVTFMELLVLGVVLLVLWWWVLARLPHPLQAPLTPGPWRVSRA